MKILNVTCVSATFELINNDIYYSKNKYNVELDGKTVLNNINTNVFSVFNLCPDTSYEVKANGKTIAFKTLKVTGIDEVYPENTKDETARLQKIINDAKDGSLININEGVYNITSLFLKSNVTLNIKKNAILKASTIQIDYKEFDETFITKDGKEAVLGNWEGSSYKMKEAIINGIEVSNTTITGEGIIDGQAQLSDWWVDFKKKPYARPHMLFLNRCENINVIGVKFMNSPQWTIHPFFSDNVHFYDFMVENPKVSPNTDGLNPQSCNGVDIIGVHFSVGDDCIAIKSGKMDMAMKYKRCCENLTIRNCLMQYGHGGVVLGSEMSAGIKGLTCERCYFDHTDRGLRIKTRRGRGKLAVIDDVYFKDIKMDGVLSPLVINMFYFCDPDGKTEYVWSKEKLPVDERTPYLGKFTFENIFAENCEYCAGYFYGLPEMPVEEINVLNSSFTYKEEAGTGIPAMMSFAEECHKRAFIFNNVKKVNIKNVKASGYEGDFITGMGNDVINNE